MKVLVFHFFASTAGGRVEESSRVDCHAAGKKDEGKSRSRNHLTIRYQPEVHWGQAFEHIHGTRTMLIGFAIPTAALS